MFSGIVEETGIIRDITGGGFSIQAQAIFEELKLGDSVAVNGVCLTVNEIKGNVFSVNVMPETLRRSNLGDLKHGATVNLERALTFAGRMGGHLVQGHIDTTGTVSRIGREGEAVLMTVAAPPEVMRYIVDKGFIAVDGLSLTVMKKTPESFTVSLVQFSRSHTTIGNKKSGDRVNLEADIIAKYVENFVANREGRINTDFLAEHGFLS
ncbi:riboflavin synthase [Dehalogenimonas sp. THU2]|uniref:riboflavin synthase n=1 Tax=Dehalogenimonas sp. THU2 TaxID=3151121 RepID=UPI0032186D9C